MNVHVSVLQEEEIKIGLESEIIQGGGTASGDYIPVPSTAEVGQTIVVKSVDENGKPTAWEAVDAADAEEIGTRLSSLADENANLKSDINNQREYLVNDYQSVNRCDNSNMADGMAISNTSGQLYDNASYVSTDYIDVSGLSIIALYACLTDSHTPYQEFWRGAWYGEDKSYMSGLNNNPIQSNPQRGVLTVPDGARYVRVCFLKNKNFSRYMCTSDGSLVDYVSYLYGHKDIITYPDWSGKSWLSYGDSITAIGNPTYIDGDIGGIALGSWQRKVRDYLHMGQCYGRGIGGQTFTYNARPWFANPDGTYNSRDDNGDMTDPSSYTVPDGCTAHYGYFASWDRITTMIPDSIKDSIDLITIFGVNDAMAALNFDPTTWTAPQWKSDSELTGVRDEAWLAADESIINSNIHGDFDITDLNGAIASTILKLQARCPNTVIVFGTSWSGKGGGESATNTGNYDTNGIAYYKHGQLVKTVAHYYSIPVVDIWGTSGVNPFNRNANNQDSTHPYKSHGKMMLARAWIGGLKGITAMID